MIGPGDLVGGRYRVEAVVGDGGTATVFRAEDEQLGMRCALKVLKLDAGSEAQLRARLRDEVAAMTRVLHPNILRVFAHGLDEEEDWIAMELSEDGSLAEAVRSGGPLSTRRAIQVLLQVLSALEASHAAGVVHRDVKPDNLLLHEDGSVRLCDFGIALLDDHTRVTRSGFAMGSIPYMAPEQRVDAHAVGPTADLYAAAATLFHLLTAATPVDLFLAAPGSPRFAGIPEGLVELIRRGTHADPGQRFASAAEMGSALAGCLALASDTALEPGEVGVYQAGSGLVTSRIETAVPSEDRSVSAIEMGLHREWLREQSERRARGSWWARSWLAILFTTTVVGVGVFGRLSMDSWIATEEAQRAAMRVPIAGTWRGTLGVHEAVLLLEGENPFLRGEMAVQLGVHEFRSKVSGEVRDGVLVLVDQGDAVRKGSYRATLAKGARLDGEYDGSGETEPFHLVRVD